MQAVEPAVDNRLAEVEAENAKLRMEVETQKVRIQSLEQKLYLLFAKVAALESDGK